MLDPLAEHTGHAVEFCLNPEVPGSFVPDEPAAPGVSPRTDEERAGRSSAGWGHADGPMGICPAVRPGRGVGVAEAPARFAH